MKRCQTGPCTMSPRCILQLNLGCKSKCKELRIQRVTERFPQLMLDPCMALSHLYHWNSCIRVFSGDAGTVVSLVSSLHGEFHGLTVSLGGLLCIGTFSWWSAFVVSPVDAGAFLGQLRQGHLAADVLPTSTLTGQPDAYKGPSE